MIQQIGPTQFYCLFDDCKNFVIDDNVWCESHWDFITSRGWDIDGIPTKNGFTPGAWRGIIDRTRESERERGITQTVTTTKDRMSLDLEDYLDQCLMPQDINRLVLERDNALLRAENSHLTQDCLEQQAQVQHWKKQSDSYKAVMLQFCDIIDPCVGTLGLPENVFECAERLAQYGQFVARELGWRPTTD